MSARLRALVVDDSEVTRAVIRRYLVEAGYDVVEAEDGVQGAVAALRELPSVVVSDLEMPVMDGFQLARLLKNDPATRTIPVIMLTSHTEAASRFWSHGSGADAYVTKDELGEQLIPTLQRLLPASPPVAGELPNAPSGPLEVVARVARQLDQGLMEATLVNEVLQVGMHKGSLGGAAGDLLAFFSRLTDADLLGIGVSEEQGTRIHLHRPSDSGCAVNVDGVVACMTGLLKAADRELLAVQVDGEMGSGSSPLDLTVASPIDLALRDARGCLVVWPRQPDLFAGLPHELLNKVAPHVALVLDNVRLAEHLWTLSTHDELTGLLNHRAIVERLNHEVERAKRYGAPLSVILSDVDRFKNINDSFGHPVGDAVLREVARRLRGSLRSSDVLGRYGGEEFLVVLPNSELPAARRAAQRLCDALAGQPIPGRSGLPPIPVTASFGVACDEEVASTTSGEGIVSLADSRLYEAKAAGRCCVKP